MANAAAGHHKPGSFLQWIVATADRAASGFEHKKFDEYNESREDITPFNQHTLRQLPSSINPQTPKRS